MTAVNLKEPWLVVMGGGGRGYNIMSSKGFQTHVGQRVLCVSGHQSVGDMHCLSGEKRTEASGIYRAV